MPTNIYNKHKKESERCQSEIVKPILEKYLGVSLREIDKQGNKTDELLDIYSGIDKLFRGDDKVQHGIALRIQDGKFRSWKSVTVRMGSLHFKNGKFYQSEFYKVWNAMQKNGLVCTYRAHFYMDDTLKNAQNIQTGILVKEQKFQTYLRNQERKGRLKVTRTKENKHKTDLFCYEYFDKIPKDFVKHRFEFETEDSLFKGE